MATALEKLKAAKAATTVAKPTIKARPTPDYKGREPGKFLSKGAPHVTTGKLGSSTEVISVCKAAAYLAGGLEKDEVKGLIDLSDKLRNVYGGQYEFKAQNIRQSLLIPASANHLPTHRADGYEIPGAVSLKGEIKAKLKAGVEGYDPDEAAFVAKANNYHKALNSMVDTAGGFVVPPPMLGDLIDLQRNLEVFSNAGATNVDLPPNGKLDFPKLTGGSTAYWVGETASATASQETTGLLNLIAKYLAVRVPLTNQLMRFASPSVEGMVRMDMAMQGALAADLAMLQGTGGTQIKGLITYPTATAWSQNTDKLLSYSVTGGIFQPEDVANMDAMLPDTVNATGWVMRPDLWARIYNRRGDAVNAGDNRGAFVFDRLRSLADGKPALFYDRTLVKSRQVSATRGNGAQTYVVTGDFKDWLIGRMGVFEFMVDPYTQLQQLTTVIQAVQYIDAGPRHAASFVLADAISIA